MAGAPHAYFIKNAKSGYGGKRKGCFEHADLLITSFLGKRGSRFTVLENYADSKRAWAVHYNEKISVCEMKIASLKKDLESILRMGRKEGRSHEQAEADSVRTHIKRYGAKLKRLSCSRNSCIKSAIWARTRLAKIHEGEAERARFGDEKAEAWRKALVEWENVSLLQASGHLGNNLSLANGALCSARSLIESGAVSAGAASLLFASKKYFSAGQPSVGISLGMGAAELLKKGSWDRVASAYLETAQLAESAGLLDEAMTLYSLGERHAPVHSENLLKSLKEGRQKCEEKISRRLEESLNSFLQQKIFFGQQNGML